jgi:hypothetical protein
MGRQPVHDRSTKHISIAYYEELHMDYKLLYMQGHSVSRLRASMYLLTIACAHKGQGRYSDRRLPPEADGGCNQHDDIIEWTAEKLPGRAR